MPASLLHAVQEEYTDDDEEGEEEEEEEEEGGFDEEEAAQGPDGQLLPPQAGSAAGQRGSRMVQLAP